MKHFMLMVIGSVLIMVAALMLVHDAYNQPRPRVTTIEEIGQPFAAEEVKEVLNRYDNLNMVFTVDKEEIIKNFHLDLKDEPAQLQEFQKILAERFGDPQKQKKVQKVSAEKKGEIHKKSEAKSVVKTIKIKIPYGINSTRITSILVEKQLINDKEKFIDLLVKLKIDDQVRAGTFNFDTSTTAVDLLLKMIAE